MMKTYAIIVSYNPNQDQLLQLYKTLVAERAFVIIVDNTEAPYLDKDLFSTDCQIVQLGFNAGIAYAQNVGVQLALSANAKALIFFDQDSIIETGFLTKMIANLRIDTTDIIYPLCVDEVSNTELPAIQIKKFGIPVPVLHENHKEPYEVDIVISSGTVATSEVFKISGLFDESLFIDYVDTEWCLRCRSKGIPIRIIPSVTMHHRIGTKLTRVGCFGVIEHTPNRCYYQLRNSFHLFRKAHIPFLFALKETVSVYFSRILLLFFVRDRLNYIKLYFKATRDGLMGIKGPKPS